MQERYTHVYNTCIDDIIIHVLYTHLHVYNYSINTHVIPLSITSFLHGGEFLRTPLDPPLVDDQPLYAPFNSQWRIQWGAMGAIAPPPPAHISLKKYVFSNHQCTLFYKYCPPLFQILDLPLIVHVDAIRYAQSDGLVSSTKLLRLPHLVTILLLLRIGKGV